MIKIRLSRLGSKKRPFYRIVAVDEKRKLSGKPLDIIGFWHPKKNDININKEKLLHWKKFGAKETQAVKKLLNK